MANFRNTYMTRALKSQDRRYATVLEKLGYSRSDMRASEQPKATKTKKPAKGASDAPVEDDSEKLALDSAREEYLLKVGKRPFMGWDVATLKEKMAAAEEGSKKSSDGD